MERLRSTQKWVISVVAWRMCKLKRYPMSSCIVYEAIKASKWVLQEIENFVVSREYAGIGVICPRGETPI